MSRLWNRLASLVPPRACLGFGLDRENVYAVKLQKEVSGFRCIPLGEQKLRLRLFEDQPLLETRDMLADALMPFSAEARSSYLPVQVALPDPAASVIVLELDEIPDNQKAREELARWRLAKILHRDAQKIACATQPIGGDQGKKLLLAIAIEQSWLTCIRDTFRQIGVTPAVIDIAGCHRFNRYYPLLTEQQRDGALVHIESETWSLTIWDAQGRLRFLRGRWHENKIDDREIVDEVERVLRTYSRPGTEKSIGAVYVSGDPESITDVAERLDAMTQEACTRLPRDAGLAAGANNEMNFASDAALAAAWPR